jgi:transcriptional regulator with XRE-family HTH domain
MCHYGCVPDLTQTLTDPWSYLVHMRDTDDSRDVTFGAMVRAARAAKGWTQDDLVEESGISRTTISRWERGDGGRYDPDQVRAVFKALGLDIREALVLLGFVTREEIGLPPQSPRMFNATTEEVIAILEDPTVPEEQKREWTEYLRFRTQRERDQRRPRRAG